MEISLNLSVLYKCLLLINYDKPITINTRVRCCLIFIGNPPHRSNSLNFWGELYQVYPLINNFLSKLNDKIPSFILSVVKFIPVSSFYAPCLRGTATLLFCQNQPGKSHQPNYGYSVFCIRISHRTDNIYLETCLALGSSPFQKNTFLKNYLAKSLYWSKF